MQQQPITCTLCAAGIRLVLCWNDFGEPDYMHQQKKPDELYGTLLTPCLSGDEHYRRGRATNDFPDNPNRRFVY
jgi:hypothetical protein